MAYRNSNYTAFYVSDCFSTSNLGAYATRDFCYYQTLKSWKAQDTNFPFIDAHAKTYNVRDSSNWETTLKPRLRERLSKSQNIILILSDYTRPSRALNEEIIYGIDTLGLPVIVAYVELDYLGFGSNISPRTQDYWKHLPEFWSRVLDVPTAHIPFKKEYFKRALTDPRFSVVTKTNNCMVAFN